MLVYQRVLTTYFFGVSEWFYFIKLGTLVEKACLIWLCSGCIVSWMFDASFWFERPFLLIGTLYCKVSFFVKIPLKYPQVIWFENRKPRFLHFFAYYFPWELIYCFIGKDIKQQRHLRQCLDLSTALDTNWYHVHSRTISYHLHVVYPHFIHAFGGGACKGPCVRVLFTPLPCFCFCQSMLFLIASCWGVFFGRGGLGE